MPMYASHPRRRVARSAAELARGLGWMSIGFGVAQLLAPRAVSRLAGVPVPAALTMLCGARELVCGLGLLTQDQAAPWLRARLAGDALDLAGLGAALLVPGVNRRRAGIASALLAGIAAADAWSAYKVADEERRLPPRHVVATIEVESTPDAVYRFWRDLGNMPQLMPRIESVQVLDDVHSHWVGKGVDGARIEWDTEIIDDEPGARLAWRSVDGSQTYNAGSLELERVADATTRLRVELLYDPPAQSLGSALARLVGLPGRGEMHADLRAFKRIIEADERNAPGAAAAR